MRYNLPLSLAAVLLTAVFSACSVPEPGLLVDEGSALFPGREEILSALPLPAVDDSSSGMVPVAAVSFSETGPFEESGDGMIPVFTEYLVPSADLHSPLRSVSSDLLRDHFLEGKPLPGTIAVVPLDSIRLPRRALPVDGMYADHQEYPLVRQVLLRLSDVPPPRPETPAERVRQALTRREREKRLKEGRALAGEWFYSLRKAAEATGGPPDLVWIHSVGDMMLGRGVSSELEGERGLERVFGAALPVLRAGDITAGNFEGTLQKGRTAVPKSYNFSFPASVLPRLEEAGFDYLMLTNNHVWDFGEAGFLDTLAAVEASSLAASGAGRDLSAASEPWLRSFGNLTISILSVGAYPTERNGFDGKTAASAGEEKPGILFAGRGGEEAVADAFSGDTFNILYVHGGDEWHGAPDDEYEALYRSFIELGADMVVGSHPHVLQRMEAWKGGLIAYSLGNFIFPGMEEMPGAEDSLILRTAVYGGRIAYVEPLPARLDGTTVDLDPDRASLERFLALP